MASRLEKEHARAMAQRFHPDGRIRQELWDALEQMVGEVATPTLIYCQSAEIAEQLHEVLYRSDVSVALLTGKKSGKEKRAIIAEFINGDYDVLIGTATLATGVDGLDKVCDQLIIFHDIVGDDALRRQLIGRIMPRGADTDTSRKLVHRFIFQPDA